MPASSINGHRSRSSSQTRMRNAPRKRICASKLKFEYAYRTDRKSTRLNSSHLVISYAVFCLKKKKISTHRLDADDYLVQPEIPVFLVPPSSRVHKTYLAVLVYSRPLALIRRSLVRSGALNTP